MQQILNTDIVDITSFDGGFVYTDKEDLEDGACKISFYEYDCETGISAPIRKSEYIARKFGPCGSRIADELGKAGVRPEPEKQITPDPFIAHKRVPVRRLIARMGLSAYDVPAPYTETGFGFPISQIARSIM